MSLLAFLILIGLLSSCSAATPKLLSIVNPAGSAKPEVPGKPAVPDPVVSFMAVSQSEQPLSNAVVTFGQPFVPGDVPGNGTLQAITSGGQKLPTQVDWKATNKDGSRRHGIITVALPKVAPEDGVLIGLYNTPGNTPGQTGAGDGHPAPVTVPKDINARLVLEINGEPYSTSFQKLAVAGVDRVWLSGPLVTEWHVSGPVVNNEGQANKRIFVQIYVRRYPSSGRRARVVFVIENTWTFKPLPRNVTYDAHLFVEGNAVYTYNDLRHTAHARWRKAFWLGGEPQVYVRHDLSYLKATGTIPNYDPDLRVPAATVRKYYQDYLASDRNPMDISIVTNPMHISGLRPDIGPLPKWTALRLLTMDPRMIEIDRGVSTLAGSWPVHLRDEETGFPVSLENHPYLTTHPNLADWHKNPLPKTTYGEYPNDLRPDWNHQPSLAFVPYLLSGDYYFLEELMFWAAWNPLRTSPAYRGYEKGLFGWMQVRGQAWSLRALGQVTYITPDEHPMKNYWQRQLQNNLKHYNAHYPKNPDANDLGFLSGLFPYNNGRAVAPWQDDYFTWAISYLAKLGFDNARPMLEYKAQFPVGRMVAPGYCWVQGAVYALNVRETESSPFYETFARAYRETMSPEMYQAYQQHGCGSAAMAKLLGKYYKPGDMSGYPWSPQGYPAQMQPALAAAVDADVLGAERAWAVFMNRTTKPDYASYPNWAIVPVQ